jgi:hypothetical protein
MSSIKLSIVFLDVVRHKMTMAKGKEKKNPHAVALSKLGAKKGGQARAAALSAEKRREIAQRAARARWAKSQKKGP